MVARTIILGLFLALLGAVPTPAPVSAQAYPITWPWLSLERIPGKFVRPVHITHAGDGSGRLFVVEKRGKIWIVEGEQVRPTPFLDIADRVVDRNEAGLLSLAFPPDFATGGYFFVYYNTKESIVEPDQPDDPDGVTDTVVARFRLSADPSVADPLSEERILVYNQPAENHNGGQIAFGPDGYLYVGLGDGGGANDRFKSGQDNGTLLSKILRIEVGSSGAYTVPATNPFVDKPGYRPEIWATGLRNPWRFSFDRLTGDLYIADVGQDLYEEVNFQPAASPGGQNYGWSIMEGTHCFQAEECDRQGLTLPVTEYPHTEENCTSIIGGVVFHSQRPGQSPVYLYGDWCTGSIRGLQRSGDGWVAAVMMETELNVLSFGESEAGTVYIGDDHGGVYKVVEDTTELTVRLHFPIMHKTEQ